MTQIKVSQIYEFEAEVGLTSKVQSNASRITNLEDNPSTGITINTVTVARYGTADYVGRRAIQDAIDAITDNTQYNRYEIKVAKGVYEATSVADFDKYPSAPCFILCKDYVSLIGDDVDETIILGELPDNLGSSFSYVLYQTIWNNANGADLKNLTVIGENMKYPLHIDDGISGNKDYNQVIDNCVIQHNGNYGDATNWPYTTALGLGMSDGHTLLVSDSVFKSEIRGAYSHNNGNFSNSSLLKFSRCRFISNNKAADSSSNIIMIDSLGSGVSDKFILEECVLNQGTLRYGSFPYVPEELENQNVDHTSYKLFAAGQEPLAIDTAGLKGTGLKITSNSTGSSSTVRISSTSTAFDIIAGDSNKSIEFENKYFRNSVYGYQYFDGGNALSGYAISGLDIGAERVGINYDKYVKSLGKRLGDCSSVNKTLSVVVDGTTYNIVFNKNYNGTSDTSVPNYTNTQIIAEITAVIGSVATVEEYIVGTDYFPLFKGVVTKLNADTTEIERGMGVVISSMGRIKKAVNSDNKIDGICLNDCIVGGRCNVMTVGEIWSQNNANSFKIKETTTGVRATGTQIGISATAGVFSSSATPKLMEATATDIFKIL